jgi:hypothetical protein
MDLSRLNGAARQPLPLEWRRHSFVRVRRPNWSDQAATAVPARAEPATSSQVTSSRARTTHDDISW